MKQPFTSLRYLDNIMFNTFNLRDLYNSMVFLLLKSEIFFKAVNLSDFIWLL